MSNRHRLAFALSLVVLAGIAAGPAQAAPRIDNPAQAPGGVEIVQPTELFRVGGDDDEVFFGSVGSIHADADGNLYVLDSQLSEVQVYSPTGEHLRTLGGEGDGPGEMRNPSDMFLDSDGNVCVLQGFPGKVVKIAPDGTPAGLVPYSVDGSPGQFHALISGQGYPGGMLLCGIRMVFSGPGQSDNIYFLDRCDAAGLRAVNLAEKTTQVNFANLVMDEGATDFPLFRNAVAKDGSIAVAIPRNGYEITVFEADGSVRHVIHRDYEPVVRTAEDSERQRDIQKAIGKNFPAPPKEIRIEETEPDIGRLFALDDGTLWVTTSRGEREHPAGSWLVLDVFDRDGKFIRQVALAGNHDARRDDLRLLPDGRLLVVVGSLDAWLNQMGTASEAAGAEADPLEIICYRITD